MKTWLIEVAIKRMGPSAIRGAILAVSGFLVAKAGVLSGYGVNYDEATKTISVNLAHIESILTVLVASGGLAGLIKGMNYHAKEIVKKPQATE